MKKKDLAYYITSHLRLNGIYWGLTALYMLGQPEALDREGVIEYVLSCWDDEIGTIVILSSRSVHLVDIN